jgi:primosomal protein N'
MSSSNSEKKTTEFRCPVCRAQQPLQPVCRRCHADLSLVVKAHQHAAQLYVALQQARMDSDSARQHQLTEELRQLRPSLLR